jgi:hypothetical protein
MTSSKWLWKHQEAPSNSSVDSMVNQTTPWTPKLSKSLSVRLWAVLPYIFQTPHRHNKLGGGAKQNKTDINVAWPFRVTMRF